ncbi:MULTISPECIES: hypothetical protein [Anoxybacillaceae]|jgi:hypothetical protein|uniref:hypothetical protein n=1 Tax=Anoxybacillaceae TaxID=3120669 RepID=UPI0004430CE3|nr:MULTISPECIES: hypothetical protein [Bacillaceae]MED4905029.1 hypothetical protein [Parageobacillus thermoglucosidasius]MED4944706.1 hypothetical protein [Parageobacillus thermoglucosidasius]MED4982360.1 hypothetical protein [Parageobacillus thermoglucosidasius]BDG31244.1 hypothetical protein PthBH41_09560 [Parageobacillus thermoglucosidasius]GAJ42330.1 hypothetical protein GT2_03_00900 [Parageobacillus thermoglucosidasius NBRC 107763]
MQKGTSEKSGAFFDDGRNEYSKQPANPRVVMMQIHKKMISKLLTWIKYIESLNFPV